MSEDERPLPNFKKGLIPTKLSNLKQVATVKLPEDEVDLGPTYEPKPQDVVTGLRGSLKKLSRHPGNERLRILAQLRIPRYRDAASKHEKTEIMSELIQAVHDAGGKFLSFDNNTWYDIGSIKAREKVGYVLRGAMKHAEASIKASEEEEDRKPKARVSEVVIGRVDDQLSFPLNPIPLPKPPAPAPNLSRHTSNESNDSADIIDPEFMRLMFPDDDLVD